MSELVPARLHVLMAHDAWRAVVIRRGLAARVGTFGWDLDTDTITPGQWLMGRLYERRADLSPDGRHMIYFVKKGRRGSWTAISRAPWLKAITFYPWGDCWNGGGLFRDNRSYWLNVGPAVADAARRRMCRWDDPRECSEHPDLRRCDDVRVLPVANNECLGVYFPRLVRDGWHWARTGDRTAQTPEVFEKPLRRGWRLRKIA